ncbi:MAG: DUF6962 family protein [Parvicellaceae bacterium]
MFEILNPTIFIGNFEWREPVTTLTDFLVAIVAFLGYLKFRSYKNKKSLSFNYFKYYFLCFAVGMTSAAWFGHGLQAYVGPEFKRIGWVCGATGLLLFGLGSLMEIKQMIKNSNYRLLKITFTIQYAVFVYLMLAPQLSDFLFAQLSSTVSLIAFILPIHLYNYVKSASKGSLFILFTIFYSIIPGLVFNNQISIDKWFNYHDISHVLMAIFMCLMIVGTSKISMLSKNNS